MIVFATWGRDLRRCVEGFRTVWLSKIMRVRRVRAPAWCAEPSETGTYERRVEIPKVTYNNENNPFDEPEKPIWNNKIVVVKKLESRKPWLKQRINKFLINFKTCKIFFKDSN